MKHIHKYRVSPAIPERLKPVLEMASNLWWCWTPDVIVLFRRINETIWEDSYYNPIELLGRVDQHRLAELANDDAFLSEMDRQYERFNKYMSRRTWFSRNHADVKDTTFAYFSAEFGLTESIKTYSGGLGILSGDHMKAASDLGLPLVGMGLLYRFGYFYQYLNADGWQQEKYPENDFYNMPVKPVLDDNQNQIKSSVEVGNRNVHFQLWKLQVGRIPLYLMDTNIDENIPEDREITAQLYGGDSEMRIRQEILLGIGGMRALQAIGITPDVAHMNEGHSAFLSFERIWQIMSEENVSFDTARELVQASNVFTTHTPVPAGNDVFDPKLVESYLIQHRTKLGLSSKDFLAFGRENPDAGEEPFSMTILALRLASFCNGVSQLHGEVSRNMWKSIWPDVPTEEIPIDAITNGIHPRTWISREMMGLLDRYLGPKWEEKPADPKIWTRVSDIPDAELWRTHERRRERLVAYARRRLKSQLIDRGAPKSEYAIAEEILDPEVLTIGFARRFATYKRATLMFRDPERLLKILNNTDRPVQIILAGKAHPRDNGGKDIIKQIANITRSPEFRKHVVFLENYDISVARYMVQGVDVWLNTPRRPMEASGTSGMKVCFNGGLNFSIPDGWWDEGYRPGNGWCIGRGEEYADPELQDEIESQALFQVLEHEIVPLFYARGSDDLPRGWIEYMKNSMRDHCPAFNVHRMVSEYNNKFYVPAMKHYHTLSQDHVAKAKVISGWRESIQRDWKNVSVSNIQTEQSTDFAVGDELTVSADIHLGSLKPDDVLAEIWYGPIDSDGDISRGTATAMTPSGACQNGVCLYVGKVPCQVSGQQGLAVRVRPYHPQMVRKFMPGLTLWG